MFCPMNVAGLLRRITCFVSGIDQTGDTFAVLKFVASILATRESIRDIILVTFALLNRKYRMQSESLKLLKLNVN